MSHEPIPVMDLRTEHLRLMDEFINATKSVIDNGQFIIGPEVVEFEKKLSTYHDIPYAVALNSGTDALVIALRALNIGPGDEVIVPSFTFFATAEAVSLVGATPMFADVDMNSYNIDIESASRLITKNTKAIIPVHLFGLVADMTGVMKLAKSHNLKVIEDNAQSFGAKHHGKLAGTFGDFCTFSFFPAKVLGALGDGGALTTHDEQLAKTSKMLRFHGCQKKYYNEICGYNSRLDEIQAAYLNIKMKYINSYIEGRQKVAKTYDKFLANTEIETPIADSGAVYGQYTVKLPENTRDAVIKNLTANKIGYAIYYPVPLHKLPLYENSGKYHCPNSEELAERVISLPIWPGMPEKTQQIVVECLKKSV